MPKHHTAARYMQVEWQPWQHQQLHHQQPLPHQPPMQHQQQHQQRQIGLLWTIAYVFSCLFGAYVATYIIPSTPDGITCVVENAFVFIARCLNLISFSPFVLARLFEKAFPLPDQEISYIFLDGAFNRTVASFGDLLKCYN